MMVACPKCALNNTIDSAFCRKCGYALPHDLVAESQEKLKELVNKGMTSFNDGNTEEAMGIAEHAIMANPAYADGHALKGMVHERRSEYAQALDCFETVVALNPDSTIDKIKLNQLRNAFAQRTAEPKVDRKGAVMAAAAAVLLVSSVGAITYQLVSGSKETPAASTPLAGTTQANLVSNPNPNSNPNLTTNPVVNPAPSNPGTQPLTDDGVKPLGADDDTPDPTSRGSLSRPRDNGWRSTEEVPVIPRGPITRSGSGSGSSSNPGPRTNNNGGLPKVDPSGSGNVPAPTNPPKGNNSDDTPTPGRSIPTPDKDDPGQIDIKITSAKGASGSEAVRRTANEMLKGGDNESAANAYEKAAKSGSGGKVHQRQAQALSASGKKAEAIAAYERAINAYENDIKSGKGNSEANQAGLNSSRQALKVLKN